MNQLAFLHRADTPYEPSSYKLYLNRLLNCLEVDQRSAESFAASIPFSLNDTTAGSENELQTAVVGEKSTVDLPLIIETSNYYKNILKRTRSGDTSAKVITELEKFLNNNTENLWENSWVRFPRSVLCAYADRVLSEDLLADKKNVTGPRRKDIERFLYTENGQTCLRIPVSYLLKLSLADVIGRSGVHPMVKEIGERLMHHFLSDNTSPETYSFCPVRLTADDDMGKGLAHETLKRYVLCQFLSMYANAKFQLKATGQQVLIYLAPNPPLRQKHLNDLISDAFYRELFMSPCLSGWDCGEAKHEYMALCHRVLSRSQLNAVAKLKEAGIITRNLVVLPNISNVSLANNGTHVSLGSLKLTRLLRNKPSEFHADDEKHLGDLVIKIVEHFLPLFAGTYSAAPYRLDFWDFHPEKALGFLPHELDFTHLRMIWRRWKKKANLKLMGQPITPFGPQWLDCFLSSCLRLKGDFVIDFRLIDYLVALLSTDQSPALDGNLQNDFRLKKDLATLGVFDTSMALYLLYRLRQFTLMGYSGFEGRYYSQFASIKTDMSAAVNLQVLLTCLAYKYILKNEIRHADIPDNPFIESERRQIFFGSAIGIPTFFVRKNTPNRFMAKILKQTAKIRLSRRYAGFFRVYNHEYLKALVSIIEKDANDLIDIMQLRETIEDLKLRIYHPEEYAVSGKLTRAILNSAGAIVPFKLAGREFNSTSETYYRKHLRKLHMEEALEILAKDFEDIDSMQSWRAGFYNPALLLILDGTSAPNFLMLLKDSLIQEQIPEDVLSRLIQLTLLTIHRDMKNQQEIDRS